MSGGWLFFAIILLGWNLYNFLDSQEPWTFLCLMMCILMSYIIYSEIRKIKDYSSNTGEKN